MKLESKIINGDSLEVLKQYPDCCIDCVITDPPYNFSSNKRYQYALNTDTPFARKKNVKGFMGKHWDILPPLELWQEIFRVMKHGALAFILMTSRFDSLWRIGYNLEKAGFITANSMMFWIYSEGFPKISNISKKIDKKSLINYISKKLEYEGLSWNDIKSMVGKDKKPKKDCWEHFINWFPELAFFDGYMIGKGEQTLTGNSNRLKGSYNKRQSFQDNPGGTKTDSIPIYEPCMQAAIQYQGFNSGFQLKPACEVIIVAKKPSKHKSTFENIFEHFEQKKNGNNSDFKLDAINIDACRIPYNGEQPNLGQRFKHGRGEGYGFKPQGDNALPDDERYAANVIAEDDALNDGIKRASGQIKPSHNHGSDKNGYTPSNTYGKYKSIPKQTIPNSGSINRCFDLDVWFAERRSRVSEEIRRTFPCIAIQKPKNKEKVFDGDKNPHPTIKPLKLFSYLIALATEPDDIILDPFAGSGTLGHAAFFNFRRYLCIEKDADYYNFAKKRLEHIEKTSLTGLFS
jgi:DNA modification methylase